MLFINLIATLLALYLCPDFVRGHSPSNFGINIVNVTYKATSAVYMNVSIGGVVQNGSIVIGLIDDIVPKTTERFRELCTGKRGYGYNGTIFHRVIHSYLIEGGDTEYGKKEGGGGQPVDKESLGKFSNNKNFVIEHSDEGFVSMANRGVDTNGTKFFITTRSADWLDGSHVCFGKVLKGMNLVKKIEVLSTIDGHKPLREAKIIGCGIWELKEPVAVVSTKTRIEHGEL